ncbi:lamin tail domain-containing protein, partial [bacterium]|nr:lamin tail domain-containing protein [bacterium]
MNILKKYQGGCIMFVLLLTHPLSSQEKVNNLIFSEIHLDANQPGNNWIEVYNPTDKPILFEGFRA